MTRTDSCVFDIYFPELGCTWHTTVEELGAGYNYQAAYEKYREMIHRHSSKGRIYESVIQTGLGSGRFFEIYGEVPTSAQFYFSDSSRYSIETSFYFETALENDSLQPVIDHVKQDLRHLISTLRWKPSYIRPRNAVVCFPDSTQR
jgi:hypothetical protein